MLVEQSSIKALPGLHRMGHTCANLNGELLFVWGGFDERDEQQHQQQQQNQDAAASSNGQLQVWIYDTLTGYWRRRTCSGQCPPPLSGSSSALLGRRMYVFGGYSTPQDKWTNSLYCLDLDTFEWRELGSQARAQPAKPIPADKCAAFAHAGHLFVFGGYGCAHTEHLPRLLDRQRDLQLEPDERWPCFGWNNQLVSYEPASNTWRWPHYSGTCPSARAAHSGALLGDRYFVFGGRDSRERLNDLHCLELVGARPHWVRLASFALGPSVPRHLSESPPRRADLPAEVELIENLAGDELDELLNPSPSSSSSAAATRGDTPASRPPVQIHSSSSDDDDEDEDDDDEDDCERPHKRCSISSCSSQRSLGCFQSADLLGPSAQPPPEQPNQQLEPHLEAAPEPEVETQNPLPVGRSFASFTAINERQVLLYGGISSQEESLADCWLLDTEQRLWQQLDLRGSHHPRLWHTGARTSSNELVILGGCASSDVNQFCTDLLTLSLGPKSLKRLALDTAAKCIRMNSVNRVTGLPANLYKLIKLRKQAIAIGSRKAPVHRTAIPVG